MKVEIHMKNKRNILLLLSFGFFLIIVTFMVTAGGGKKPKARYAFKPEAEEAVSTPDTQYLVIVTGKNKEDNSITLQGMEQEDTMKVTVTGGSDIRDKYNKAITMDRILLGEIVWVTYAKDTGKLKSLKISDTTFTYKGVSNWYFDKENQAIYIGDTVYKYNDATVVQRNDQLLTIEDVNQKDELTIRGKDRDIYSIEVTKGHGTIYFSQYEDFIGGIAYIGRREIIPIVEDMNITARVGTFDITFEQGELKGTKTVTVDTGGEVFVSMEEFKKPPIQKGMVSFHIKPLGADLFLNEKEYSYEDPVELEYGEYLMKVSLGGYITYTGKLNVKEEEQVIYVELVEEGLEPPSNPSESESGNEVDEVTEIPSDEENDAPESVPSLDKGYLYIEGPEGASVYFNGEFRGIAPTAFSKVVGTHYITFILSGYETKTYTVELLEDGKDKELNFPNLTKLSE